MSKHTAQAGLLTLQLPHLPFPWDRSLLQAPRETINVRKSGNQNLPKEISVLWIIRVAAAYGPCQVGWKFIITKRLPRRGWDADFRVAFGTFSEVLPV